MQKKKASDSIIFDIVLQLSFLLDSGKIYRKVGRADCGNDFSDTLQSVSACNLSALLMDEKRLFSVCAA